MCKSLQEQLQEAGLSGSKKKKAKKSTWGRVNRHQPDKASKPSKEIEQIRQQAAKRQAEEAERNRRLNEEKRAAQQSHDRKAQARQLILEHAQPRPSNGKPFYFVDRGVVLSILVTDTTRRQLANRRLGLAKLDERYYIIPAQTVAKVLEREPKHIIALPDGGAGDDTHPVPDDLIW
ncbi:MAG TPA: DUF2058 domain-containing protein [Halothiobacillaceae bacterium]|nr:DUF2058 domain-containing protein [Halothiobacillaceae bacterium]